MHTFGHSHHVAQSRSPHQKDRPRVAAAGGGGPAAREQPTLLADETETGQLIQKLLGEASMLVKLPHIHIFFRKKTKNMLMYVVGDRYQRGYASHH